MGTPVQRLPSIFATAATVVLSLSLETGCRPPTPTPIAADSLPLDLVTMDMPVPQHVRRLAVWYPRAGEPELASGYPTLKESTVQLTRQRSLIKILDRRNVD